MSTTPPRQRKGGRRKTTTDIGAAIIKRERQRLAREQAELEAQLQAEALRQRAFNDQHHVRREVLPEHVAISRGIIRRIAGALASENVLPIINAFPTSGNFKAWTDFKQIHLTYKVEDDKRLMAAIIRGLAYHEGGHMRFTVPYLDLAELVSRDNGGFIPTPPGCGNYRNDDRLHHAWNVLEDQRMELAVVSDSPSKAAYFTPMILAEFVDTVEKATANFPVLAWRRYLPSKVLRGARKAFVERWGEDLTVEMEGIIERYIFATTAIAMWTSVCEMFVLLQRIRPPQIDFGHSKQRQRQAPPEGWEDFMEIPIDPSMLPQAEDIEEDTEEDIEDDETDEEPASEDDSKPVVRDTEEDEDDLDDEDDEDFDFGDDDEDDLDDVDDDEGVSQDDEESADTEDGEADDDEDEPEDEPEEPDANGGHDSSDTTDEEDDEGDDDDDHGHGAGGPDEEEDHTPAEDDDLTDDDLQEALQEAEEERLNDRALDGDVEGFQDALENQTSYLEPYLGGISSDVGAAAQAENLAAEIEAAFRAVTMDRAPAWVEQQRRGILNVQRYVTRNPGDVEFFRQFVDDDQPGFDMSVSVLLDYSGSMDWYIDKLAQAGYACKVACQNLGIPCTVTLWDHWAKTLWDADEHAEHLPVISTAGSTDPERALNDLENQRYERTKHIVLFMTDGGFDDDTWKPKRTFAFWKDAGRVFIGFAFGGGTSARTLVERGCHEAYNIKDLMDIPRHLERMLIELG